MKQAIDLTNRQVEKLTVLHRVDDKVYIGKNGQKRNVAQWFCVCECGNTCTRSEVALLKGLTTSCGCNKTCNAKDYSGQKFNHLTVLYKNGSITQKGKKITVYRCRCDCGNECDITAPHLKTTKTCGCRMNIVANLAGKRFGKLLVIDRAPNRTIHRKDDSTVMWNCICDCGNKCVKPSSYILHGITSCGCNSEATQFKKVDNHLDITSKPYGIGYCLGGKRKFYFDIEDYDKIKQYSWTVDKNGYVYTTNIDGHTHLMLKNLVMGVPQSDEEVVVNFIHSNNRHDNRKCNLWVCNRNQAQWGSARSANNSTGITGVWYNKSYGVYTAGITENGNTHTFTTTNINKAIAVRKQWEEKYFGKYSYDNRQAIEINE